VGNLVKGIKAFGEKSVLQIESLANMQMKG